MDSSNFLIDKYLKCQSKVLIITLKDKSIVKGIIAGYFREDDSPDSSIIKWHIIPESDLNLNAMELIGAISGKIIRHKDIFSIKFEEDYSIFMPSN